jgi:hypothetical protein
VRHATQCQVGGASLNGARGKSRVPAVPLGRHTQTVSAVWPHDALA